MMDGLAPWRRGTQIRRKERERTMNQSVLHTDIILRDRTRERDAHVAEGRVLRALDAAASGRGNRRQPSSAGSFPEPSGIRARIRELWRELPLPARPGVQRPLCACPESPV
jgi:hypothetical protein